jgi:hypothetical protein
MAWGRTHNIINPIKEQCENKPLGPTPLPPVPYRPNLPNVGCCEGLEIQIQDLYKKVCSITNGTFNLSFDSATNTLSLTINGTTQTVVINTTSSIPDDIVYYGTQFSNSTTLLDTALLNKRYRLFYRGMGSTLIRSVEWQYNYLGGFTILMQNFAVDPADIFFVQFY